ncbi:MAG: GNAT family N-acetyltransferase [Microvirgula sp.]
MIDIIDVTDAVGALLRPDLLAQAADVHRELRPGLPADYPAFMAGLFAGGGRMLVALDVERRVLGLAVWRCHINTWANGPFFYVDDLVTRAAQRSQGVGQRLIAALEARALAAGADTLHLDSATHRHDAHRFYFREGMHIATFHFAKPLTK